MKKVFSFFVLAIIINEAVCMSFRHKRQSPEDEDNDLDERYGRPDWGRWPQSNRPRPQFPDNGQNWPRPDNGQTWPRPDNGQPQPQPTPAPNGATTQQPEIAACIRRCPTTAEYNPVCGSDAVTYNNPGALTCARQCGVNVDLQRASRCPTTTTAAPS